MRLTIGDDCTAFGVEKACFARNRAPAPHFPSKRGQFLFAIGANTLVLSSCDLIGILPLKCRKSNQRSKIIN
jgi:hypothetical protein